MMILRAVGGNLGTKYLRRRIFCMEVVVDRSGKWRRKGCINWRSIPISFKFLTACYNFFIPPSANIFSQPNTLFWWSKLKNHTNLPRHSALSKLRSDSKEQVSSTIHPSFRSRSATSIWISVSTPEISSGANWPIILCINRVWEGRLWGPLLSWPPWRRRRVPMRGSRARSAAIRKLASFWLKSALEINSGISSLSTSPRRWSSSSKELYRTR